MRYSFQIPIPHLHDVQGDFDFALAHLVLTDADYRKFYRDQHEVNREVWLDNSIHELGTPLTLDEILKAAEYIQPDKIIPPDWHSDMERTFIAFQAACDALPRLMLAPVVQGKNIQELRECYFRYLDYGVTTVCIPYRLRDERFKLIPDMNLGITHHFLSLNYMDELYIMRDAPNAQMDTGKPFRYAQHDGLMSVMDKDPLPPPKLDMYKKCDLDLVNEQLYVMYQLGRRKWQRF